MKCFVEQQSQVPMRQPGAAADALASVAAALLLAARWQTRITNAAASDAVVWTLRLADHPAIAAALTSGEVSVS